MSLLSGGSSSKKGFQGAASNVRPKAQVGAGFINVNKLKGIQNKKKVGFEAYKLNQNGLSRFRLVMPIGNDDTPMVSADQHWVPTANDDAKIYKKPIFCYKQFGFSDCPICALYERLTAARDQAIVDAANDLRLNYRWAAYVVNRDYLAGSDDPERDFDPRQDKIQLFSPISTRIADDIIAYLGKRTWGNASDPENGYDFEVEGEQTGKVFNGFKVSDFTVSPVPKDCSPAYSMDLLRGLKPLSEVVTYMKRQDIQKILDPLLVSIANDSEEGADIVNSFNPYYQQLLDEIAHGPSVSDDDFEREQIEVSGGNEDDNKTRVNAPLSDTAQGEGEDDNNAEDETNGDREGVADNQSSGEDEEDIEDIEEEEEEEEEEPQQAATARPAPQTRPKPAGPLPSTRPVAQAAKPSANAGLLGKLKQVGKR